MEVKLRQEGEATWTRYEISKRTSSKVEMNEDALYIQAVEFEARLEGSAL